MPFEEGEIQTAAVHYAYVCKKPMPQPKEEEPEEGEEGELEEGEEVEEVEEEKVDEDE